MDEHLGRLGVAADGPVALQPMSQGSSTKRIPPILRALTAPMRTALALTADLERGQLDRAPEPLMPGLMKLGFVESWRRVATQLDPATGRLRHFACATLTDKGRSASRVARAFCGVAREPSVPVNAR